MGAGIVELIAQLAPVVTNLIIHIKHPDGTSTAIVLASAKSANDLNAQNIQQFLAALGTATKPAS